MEPRVSVVLSLRQLPSGEVAIGIERETGRGSLAVEAATLVLTLWPEGPEIVRGRIDHLASGTVAYLQGSGAILAMAQALRVRVNT
ncbi:MAG: hypothetical protein JWM87_859 [Candidatus Eremiobacteraeota bacterium]|nr:hypothetical protein [Candidatus Eremiobacteraeota bacterium]